MTLARALGDTTFLGAGLAAIGDIAAARGELEQAARLLGAAEAMYQVAAAWSFIAARGAANRRSLAAGAHLNWRWKSGPGMGPLDVLASAYGLSHRSSHTARCRGHGRRHQLPTIRRGSAGVSALPLDELSLAPGERFPLLAIDTGAEDAIGTSAEVYRLWYQLALASGETGWVPAAVPTPAYVGSDGRPAAVRVDFLPLVLTPPP